MRLTRGSLAGKIAHMFYANSPASLTRRSCSPQLIITVSIALLIILSAVGSASAQAYQKELDTTENPSLSIKSRSGRVRVVASEEIQKKIVLEATSTGALVDPTHVTAVSKGSSVNIEVAERSEKDRIDLVVRVPLRSKLKIESEAGAVDVVGNFESAEVTSNTGTIHADVPLDALKFNFMWRASKPRFLSDVELPEVKEKAGGVFTISGKLGEEKPEKEQRVQLTFITQRGVVLLNVDPSMVPSDLRERPLTEAAKSIVRSGDSQLIDSIRKVSPKMFGDYARTLPPPEKEPTLVRRAQPGQFVSELVAATDAF